MHYYLCLEFDCSESADIHRSVSDCIPAQVLAYTQTCTRKLTLENLFGIPKCNFPCCMKESSLASLSRNRREVDPAHIKESWQKLKHSESPNRQYLRNCWRSDIKF